MKKILWSFLIGFIIASILTSIIFCNFIEYIHLKYEDNVYIERSGFELGSETISELQKYGIPGTRGYLCWIPQKFVYDLIGDNFGKIAKDIYKFIVKGTHDRFIKFESHQPDY